MSVTLAPLASTVVQMPWGPETIHPTADEVAIYTALTSLAAGTPVANLAAGYQQPNPFMVQSCLYRPGTQAIVTAIQAIAGPTQAPPAVT